MVVKESCDQASFYSWCVRQVSVKRYMYYFWSTKLKVYPCLWKLTFSLKLLRIKVFMTKKIIHSETRCLILAHSEQYSTRSIFWLTMKYYGYEALLRAIVSRTCIYRCMFESVNPNGYIFSNFLSTSVINHSHFQR